MKVDNTVLIISDMHLGSDAFCFEEVARELEHLPEEAGVIVCNGDFVHGKHPDKLEEAYGAVMEYADEHPQKQIIFITGNHEAPEAFTQFRKKNGRK